MKILRARGIVILVTAGVLWFGFVIYYSLDNQSKDQRMVFSGKTMGTTYSVKIRGSQPLEDRATTEAKIEATLAEVNQTFSTWQADSSISGFNQTKTLDWIEVPEELWQLVDTAKALWFVTGGLYDVSAGALFQLWGFGSNQQTAPPEKQAIVQVLKTVGMQHLEIHEERFALRKRVKELQLDLSSIAKGYGVDAVGKMLEEEGVEHYLVEIGGEIRVRGRKSNAQKWHIAVEKPVDNLRAVEEVLALADQSMATSGNYRNFFEENGERYAHIFDVKRGYPAKSRLASVSVFAETTILADGWSTALFAIGAEKAMRLAKIMNLPVLLILHPKKQQEEGKTLDEFEIWYSPKMVQMIKNREIDLVRKKIEKF